MISNDKQEALVRMFCAFCKRVLLNSRNDILRAQARHAQHEVAFTDMREEELAAIAAPKPAHTTVFNVLGREVVVLSDTVADAIRRLDARAQAIVLLYYFAEWPDREIAEVLGVSRSTVQACRQAALGDMQALFMEGGEADAPYAL